MARIGVFVCWCGENIGRMVDCPAVAAAARDMSQVVHAEDYKYMCSDPGQQRLIDAIRQKHLTGVVVASCSPRMHEPTFRAAAEAAGLNQFMVEMANLREHCSWVHDDRQEATAKSIDLVRMMVAKVRRNERLSPIRVPITDRALVIGGGIAGIQAALDIADSGHEVVLVERSPSIGGHMSQLSETFPTLDCSQCILTPRMVEVARHPRIRLMTCTELQDVEGYVGNFSVTLETRARYVDLERCTGCGACLEVCPVKNVPGEFDESLATRGAIYRPFPQAVPNKPVIDPQCCLRHKAAGRKGISAAESNVCGKCAEVCPIPGKAIDFGDAPSTVVENFGAIVVATGFDVRPVSDFPEYGGGRFADVITGLQFERLLSASGPTEGQVRRVSDGRPARRVVLVACAGSRDAAKGCAYCSKICCMYSSKHAMLFRHKCHDGQATVFYMDLRAAGKGYDEFTRRAAEEDGVSYVRGRVSRVYRRGDSLVVCGVDTLLGRKVEVEADLVVLATAAVPQKDVRQLAQKLGVSYDSHGWLSEAHPKLRPVETATAGVFLAGACQGPRDIPEAVAQAGGAAAKAMVLLSKRMLDREPIVARIDERACDLCGTCIKVCPVGAIEAQPSGSRPVRQVAFVNEGLCIGCGTCVASCRSKAPDLAGFTDQQLYRSILATADGTIAAAAGGNGQPSAKGDAGEAGR